MTENGIGWQYRKIQINLLTTLLFTANSLKIRQFQLKRAFSGGHVHMGGGMIMVTKLGEQFT